MPWMIPHTFTSSAQRQSNSVWSHIWPAAPAHWGRSIVQGKTYDASDPDFEYVEHAFRALQGGARLEVGWDDDLARVDLDLAEARYGEPVLTRPRLGQGSFRLAVLEAYLPAQLDDAELASIVDKAVDAVAAQLGETPGPKQMGQVMKAVNAEVAGRAEGGRVAAAVKAKLTN